MESNFNAEKAVAIMSGQLMALGAGLQAALKHHPHREEVAATIHDNLERMLSKLLTTPLSDDVIRGVESARDMFLLKRPKA